MKRIVAFSLLALSGFTLAGCPIYPSETECLDDYDCPSSYYCTDRGYCARLPSTGGSGGAAQPSGTCDTPMDCGVNETCGADKRCHVGDCSFHGCVAPYQCILDGYVYACELPRDGGTGGSSTGGAGGTSGTGGTNTGGSAGADAGDGGTAGSSGTGGQGDDAGMAGSGAGGAADAATPVYCGNPNDCDIGQVCTPAGLCKPGSCIDLGCIDGYHCSSTTPPAECVANNSASCIGDADCQSLGDTYRCIAGLCTAPADQCVDKTQCPHPTTQNCVEGKCVTSCQTDDDCPAAFKCDTTHGVCTVPATVCTTTSDCGSSTIVCVDGACVDRCGAGGACDLGFVCVANGCVPDTSPAEFICSVEGQQDACQTGSICLHHNCYITCTISPDSCAFNPPGLDVCKQVNATGGPYTVCGSSSNLGSECDPGSSASSCSGGKVCIDGYCR